MRDAVALEASGKPTAIVVNDVFTPIAHATAALLALPADYVARNVVWLPHPTSNLSRAAVSALVDERIGLIRDALLGRLAAATAPGAAGSGGDALALARETVAGLAGSLRADGAELVLVGYGDGVLAGELRIGDLTCDDGSCIMPADALAKMIEALVRPKLPALREVRLLETGNARA
jgi:hypothetical protein